MTKISDLLRRMDRLERTLTRSASEKVPAGEKQKFLNLLKEAKKMADSWAQDDRMNGELVVDMLEELIDEVSKLL